MNEHDPTSETEAAGDAEVKFEVKVEIEADANPEDEAEAEFKTETEASSEDDAEVDFGTAAPTDTDAATDTDATTELLADQPSPPDPVDGVPETHRLSLTAKLEALLFLSPDPLTVGQLVEACESSESKIEQAISALDEDCAQGRRGIVLRRISGGYTLATAAGADAAARRLFAKPRTPPLTQAQAECLAVIAYLQPVSRPEIARIRGVSSESALSTLLERGLVADAGRSKFGAVIFKTTELFDRLFGLEGLDALPDVAAFDPSPEDARDLRERLLKAGDQREAAQPQTG